MRMVVYISSFTRGHLERNLKWIVKSNFKQEGVSRCFQLSEFGYDNIPKGIKLEVSKQRDNAGKLEFLMKSLLKQCNEAKPDKTQIFFDILKDGQYHELDEFLDATGYKNLKSKGLGYPFSHMEKKMKILERHPDHKIQYRLTDKCFPTGRPTM